MKEAEMSVDELAQKIRDFATIEKLRQALKRAEEMEKEDKDMGMDSDDDDEMGIPMGANNCADPMDIKPLIDSIFEK